MLKNTQLLATFLISIILIGCTEDRNTPKIRACEDTIDCLETTFSQEIIPDQEKQDFLLFNNGGPIGLAIDISFDCLKNLPDSADPQNVEDFKEIIANTIKPRLRTAKILNESSDYSDYLQIGIRGAGSFPSPEIYGILVIEFKKTFTNPEKPEMRGTLTSWRRIKTLYNPGQEDLDNFKKMLLNLSDEFLVEFLGVNAKGVSQ